MYIKEFSMRRTRRLRKIKGIIGNGDSQGEAFFFVLFFSVVSTVIDILSSSAMNNCGGWWTYQILMTVYVISMPLLAVVWGGYAYILIHHDEPVRASLKKIFLMAIPYIAYVLIAASNPFTGLFFKLSSNMEYEKGVFFMPVGVGSIMFYSGAGLFLVLSGWKKLASRHNEFLLTLFFFVYRRFDLGSACASGLADNKCQLRCHLCMVRYCHRRSEKAAFVSGN